jgi:hypothetical protein
MTRSAWIRGPFWDGTWILSGIPLGVAFVLASVWLPLFVPVCPAAARFHPALCNPIGAMMKLISIYAIVLLDFGHNLSPMCLAWTNDGFRQVMLKRPIRFIAAPLILLVIGTGAGIVSAKWFPTWQPFVNSAMNPLEVARPRLGNPFWWLLVIYLLWNFARQNFGVLSIYRLKSGPSFYSTNQRQVDLAFSFVTQGAVLSTTFLVFIRSESLLQTVSMLYSLLVVGLLSIVIREAVFTGRCWSPRIVFAMGQILCSLAPGLFALAANSVNHWLVAIGLASHVDGNTHSRSPAVFAAVVIVLGVVLFWALFWKSGAALSWNLRNMIDLALPYTGFRLALGLVHFLYDRWIWRLSDPRVHETIGKALLA